MSSPSTIEEANAELTLRLRQQELAAEFANFSLATDDLDPILHEACRTAARGMECSLAKVLEYLPDEHSFVMRAGVGWRPGTVGHARLGSDLESPAGYAFQTGQPVLSNHLAAETRFRTPRLLVEHDVHRAFNVLVAVGGDRYGVLEVDSPDERDFTLSDTAFLETLAATLAQAIGRTRRMGELARAQRELKRLNAALQGDVRDRTRERDQLWALGEDLLVVAGYDDALLKANPYWTRLLGWSEDEIMSGGYTRLIHPDDLERVIGELTHMRTSGSTARYENRVVARDGSHRWVAWTLTPEPGGERMFGVGRDVTAAKAREEELAKAHESLRQSQKMEAVGQLTGGLAHDFNNLLTGITGSLDLMRRRIVQGRIGELGRYVDLAMSSAERAAALTHRLLAFSRRQTLDAKPTEVGRLVAGMRDLIRRTIGPSVDLDIAIAPDAWTVLVDPNQLENALLNLCINARDAMPDGGRLTVETSNRRVDAHGGLMRDIDAGSYLVLSVTDTGTGMPPEVVDRVFEPFFTTKPLGTGTGLGLSMIYGFTKQSGGQVRIHSQPGLGTTVTLYLPRHDGETAGPVKADEGPVALPRAEDGETVLVVDDEPAVRLLVGEVLADLGYTAVEAADGAGGLRILQTDMRIDLLVTDVGLPGGMNGRQVADAARVLRPGLKVLFITGYAETAAVSGTHLDPGMAVMTKPFAMDDLANRIRDLIEA
ncbi:ATP-binding protein [Lichenibacterium dinghuense]|uniref:ATP-binding protein n=1 Tax=Lichenibacterium dinghuense TaxID=2895977 RepID=UPI003D174EA8